MNIELVLYAFIFIIIVFWVIQKVKKEQNTTELLTAPPTHLRKNSNLAETLSTYLEVVPLPVLPATTEAIPQTEPVLPEIIANNTTEPVVSADTLPQEGETASKEIFRRTAVSREDYRRERVSLEEASRQNTGTNTSTENANNQEVNENSESEGFIFNPQHAIIYQEILKRKYE